MNRKALCVCLLAFAGSSLFVARKALVHRSSRPRLVREFLGPTPVRDLGARSAPIRVDALPQRERTTIAGSRSVIAGDASRATNRRTHSFSLAFAFEPNLGQVDSRVTVVGRGKGLTVFLTRREIAVQITRRPRTARAAISSEPRMISMRFSGAPPLAWCGNKRLRGETNYFIGNDPRRWRVHVPHFAEAGAANVAPGIDMVLYGNDEGVEYDLRAAPGADLSKLRLTISGADAMQFTQTGDVLLTADGSELRMKRPAIYEEVSGRSATRKAVDGGYVLGADGSLGFRVGPHDPHAVLIIDPSLSVAYATFLGGTGTDTAMSAALDGAGKVYVGGTTTSTATFPGAPHTLGPGGGTSEFFIAKIDPTVSGANSLVYLTFLGGSEAQNGGIIAVNSGGNVAITGTTTSPDFPVTDSSLPTSALARGVGNDVAISEIDPTGSMLVFSTLFGGSGAESQNGNGGIAFDSSGDVYIASDTNTTSLDSTSADLPVTADAYQGTWDGDESDGFLAIFTPPAQPGGAATLKYCSYLGTNALAQVSVGGVAVDPTGSAYIAGGVQNASAFPFTNAFQTVYGGGESNAFLMKIAPLGQGSVDLVYATLIGGSGTDQAFAIALDTDTPPSAYVTGATNSPDFPTKGLLAGFSTTLNPSATANAFFVAVGQSGSGQTSLLYSTYLGGSTTDAGQSIAVAAPNEVYISGTTSSWDFPWHDNVQPFNGQTVAFVAKFDPTSAGVASLTYATPLGGTLGASQSGGAAGNAVAADSLGHVYLAGATTSVDFPTAVTSGGASLNGNQSMCSSCWNSPAVPDAFVVELLEQAAPQPALTFEDPHLTFPSTATQSLGLINTGDETLKVANFTIAGANSGDFSLIGESACLSQVLGAGASCALAVAFSPSATGYESAVLMVTDNAPGSPQEFELLGYAPGLAALPISVTFPAQSVGTASDAEQLTFTVVNPVKATLIIDSGPSLGGANPGEFQLVAGTPGCILGESMNPNTSCDASVTFVPQAAGTFQSEIDVTYHWTGGAEQKLVVPVTASASVTLSGAVSVASSVNFGSQIAGTAGAAQPITITNSATGASAGPLTFSGVNVNGSSSSDFDVTSNNCSAGSTPPGGTCTVQITFRPLQAPTCGTESTRSATLTLSDNAPGSPQRVALAGTAEDFCFSAPSGQAAGAPITPGETATYNLQVNSSAGFSGTVALSCAGAPTEASCTLSPSSVSVTPTAPGAFTVSVATTAPVTGLLPPLGRRPGPPPNLLALTMILTALGVILAISLKVQRKWRVARLAVRGRGSTVSVVRVIQAVGLFFALGAGLAACGGGGTSDTTASDPGTPFGTYTITVTATVTAGSTTATRTLQLPLTVN